MSQSDAPEGEENSSPELPTHRRSTFEPPTEMDDDALAAALSEELGRVTRTGAIPVQPPPVVPVPSPMTPPVRQSLPDDALVQWIGEGATLEAMEQLEREMSLRQKDAEAFSAWEQSMVALGTPEALGALDHARAAFADVIDPSTGAIPTTPQAPEPMAPPPPPVAPPMPEYIDVPAASPVPPEVFAAPPVAENVEFPPATMSEDEAWPANETGVEVTPLPVGSEHDDAAELNEAQLA
ncbi:MAG TPA: hypothetical protein PK890_11390, partial [Terrimesophilobacter sp.]|nr:hypothetical protein [Terrimesophilobacter sp.]